MRDERFWTETNRSAAVLSVGLLGDALLYLVLPVSYAAFGITSVWVGVLLSANRFIRIGANSTVAAAARRRGLAPIMLAGAILAAGTTLSYGLLAGGMALFAARLVWGISFATLRLGALGFAADGARSTLGRRLGSSGSLAQLGPLLAVTAGGMMAQALGPRETFIILGLVSMIGIPIAMSLPRSDVREPVGAKREMRFRRPNAVESTMGIVALLADGLCIVTLTLLLMEEGRDRLEAISIGGILLGARQVALTLAPALAGSLADRFGSKRALLGVLLSMAAGLALMTTGRVEAGFLLVCPSAAMASTLLPGVAAARPGGDRLAAISAVVTWRDLGAAVGALATGSLLTVVDLPVLYLIAPLLLLAAAWWLWMEMDRGWSRETG